MLRLRLYERKKKEKKKFRPKGPGYVKAFFTDGHPWRKGGGLIPWDQMDAPKICSPPDGEGVV